MAEESTPTPPPQSTQSSSSPAIKLLYAIGASTSAVVSGTFFVALAYYRDALMIAFFIGSIGNAILGKILKRILNQERPSELDTVDMQLKPSDKGMPSSHAMSLGFIGTFTSLVLHANAILPGIPIPILLYSLVSLWYRIDTKLHTWQQISVGFVVGSTNGVLWYALCDGSRNPFNMNVLALVRDNLLNEQGVLPMVYLVVPALVGVIVVGSVERRISGWIQQFKQNKSKDE